ncbi:MAG: hypothetical protein IT294_08895 [Deltaproteobacteria bacterium]|nr:hypothetical protein [Deltaproteobacteria bacterium]
MQSLPRYFVGTILALASGLLVAAPADAQSVTVNRCAAAKVRCVMGYTHVCGVQGVLGLFKCHQNATLRGRFVDQVCVNRTVDKITECFRDAERRGVCLTNDDVVAIQGKVEAFVLDAVEALTPGFPYPLVNTCAAGKQKALAEATSDKLECFEDAMRRDPGEIDPGCLARPDGQYAYLWDRIEGNGGCLTLDDDAALLEKADAFIADVVTALDPQ